MNISEHSVKQTKEGYLLEIKVIPQAGKTELIKTESGLRVRIQYAPVDGKANEALITLLSKEFGVPKTGIEIVRGKTSRNKTVLFRQR